MGLIRFNNTIYPPTIRRPSLAEFEEAIYVVNDRSKMRVVYGYDTDNMFNAGIDAPTAFTMSAVATVGGISELGKYFGRYRYMNSRTGFVSGKSPEGSMEVNSASIDGRWAVTASSDAKVDTIILEVLVPGARVWQEVSRESNTTTNYDKVMTLTMGTDITDYGLDDSPGIIRHDRPPYFHSVISHRGHLFGVGRFVETTGTCTTDGTTAVTGQNTKFTDAMVGRIFRMEGQTETQFVASVASDTSLTLEAAYSVSVTAGEYTIAPVSPNALYWSQALFPESWDEDNNFENVLLKTDDNPIALASYFDAVMIFGSHSTEAFIFTAGPGVDAKVQPVSERRGAINQECVVRVDNVLFVLDRHGIWAYKGGLPAHLSFAIDEILDASAPGFPGIDWSDAFNTFHGTYHPDRREVIWWVKEQGSSEQNLAIRYHVDYGTFTFGRYIADVRCSMTAPDENQVLRAVVATSGANTGAYWYYYGVGDADGIHAGQNASLVADTGSTTSSVVVIGGLSTFRESLHGAPFVVEGIGSGIIKSNTRTSIEPLVSLATAPSGGENIYIGVIETKTDTGWVSMGDPRQDGNFRWLEILHTPTTSGTLKVQFYQDYDEDNPIDVTTDAAAFNARFDNLEIDANDLTTIECEIGKGTQGYLRVPVTSERAKVMRARVTTDTPRNPFRINALGFVGAGTQDKTA